MISFAVVIHIATRPHSPLLAPFIRSFHYHESELNPTVERILPNGQAHLMINLAEDEFRSYTGPDGGTVHRVCGSVLAGPHDRPTAIDTIEQRRMIAVEFNLGGAAVFVPIPLAETSNRMVALDDIWGRDGRFLRERLCDAPTPSAKLRLLESMLLRRLRSPSDRSIGAAISLLDRGMPVAEARTRLGLLPKTFVRRFREQVGLAPKRLFRVRRLQRVLGSVSHSARVDWASIAAEQGYTDQAHLIHDFQDLTDLTPSAYRPSSAQRRNHVPIAGFPNDAFLQDKPARLQLP
jgi:AraC-like DNA-binding protein